jgi:hypothetical protein
MPAMLWRILLAVIAAVLIYALLPPFFRIVGFEPNADVFTVLKVCIAGLLVFYVLKGPPVPM